MNSNQLNVPARRTYPNETMTSFRGSSRHGFTGTGLGSSMNYDIIAFLHLFRQRIG